MRWNQENRGINLLPTSLLDNDHSAQNKNGDIDDDNNESIGCGTRKSLARIVRVDCQVWEALSTEERQGETLLMQEWTEGQRERTARSQSQRRTRKQMLAYTLFWVARALYHVNKLEDTHVCALRCMGLLE
jgi:hypothetical protein